MSRSNLHPVCPEREDPPLCALAQVRRALRGLPRLNVAVVRHPTLTLEGDVVVTEAGTHPQVSALVYIAAFVPDQGESLQTLIADPPPGAPVPPILPPRNGLLALDKHQFAASFAGDLKPELAQFMADSQVLWGVDAVGGTVSNPAWRSKPAGISSLPTTG